MDSVFSTVKSERGEHCDSHGEANMELFDYIEGFYNQVFGIRNRLRRFLATTSRPLRASAGGSGTGRGACCGRREHATAVRSAVRFLQTTSPVLV